MKPLKIDLVRGDDWLGLYIDGRLVEERWVSFPEEDILELVGHSCSTVWATDFCRQQGWRLPDDLSEVSADD